MAAADPDFAEALYQQRSQAIVASGAKLTATEAAILSSIDTATLRAMVGRMRGALPEPERRSFLRRATAALLALVGGGTAAVASVGCRDADAGRNVKPPPAVTGARPDRPPPPDPETPDTKTTPPAESDTSEPKPKPKPAPPAGIRPDRLRPSRGIRPDRPTKKDP